MSEQYPDQPGRSTDELRREGQQMVGETQHDAERVVRHAGEEAGAVVDTARREVRDVVDEAVDTMSREADERTRQFGHTLHDLSDDLHRMARGEGADHSTASEYVDAIAATMDRVAERMEEGGSTGIVDSVRTTADRRPGAFITGSVVAGFVVGRLIRNGDRSAAIGGGEGSAERSTERSTQSQREPDQEIDLRERRPSEQVPTEPQRSPDPGLATVGARRREPGPVPPPPPGPPDAPPERF